MDAFDKFTYWINDPPYEYFSNHIHHITIEEGITNIGKYAFDYLHNVKTFVIPPSVTLIENEAFSECNSLTSVELSSNVLVLQSNTFENCINLQHITIPPFLKEIRESCFEMCKIEEVVLPSTLEYLESAVFKNSL